MSVIVEQYDPDWPQQFDQIRSEIKKYFHDVSHTFIEHVGSTSVPGLAAQSIIDIDITVSRHDMQAVLHALLTNGDYDYAEDIGIADCLVVKDYNQYPRHSINICLDDGALVRSHRKFRNLLRSDSKLRDDYAQMKSAAGANPVGYKEEKGAFIHEILTASGILTSGEIAVIEALNTKTEAWSTVWTKRLLLREFTMQDVNGYYALERNEENARYQDWPPRTLEQARELVAANIQSSSTSPRTIWELVVESEGRMVGRVGAMMKQLDSNNPTDVALHFDLWFSFLPLVQGKGFATEASKAFIDVLVEKHGGEQVELEIECDPRNTGSSRLAERLGFEKHSLTERAWESKGEWVDSLVYRKIV
jgi:GrpB-like predicted nucleotidyltransferase (UPF0157 family)/RimJ/RimL family protein N-acetyltransferase